MRDGMTHELVSSDDIVQFLEADDRLLVPMADIISHFANSGLTAQPFFTMLANDDQFYIHMADGQSLLPSPPQDGEEPDELLTSIGINFGPKVMLKSKAPNADTLLRESAKELKTVRDALLQAYAHRTKTDTELEATIIAALKKAKQVEQAMIKLIENVPKKN